MKKIKDIHLGLVGATGLVGQQMLAILEERKMVPKSLKLAASEKSLGKTCMFAGKEIDVEVLEPGFFDGLDIVLASAGSHVSKMYFTPDNLNGTYVIDNCSFFRMDENVPLVIPEVNGFELSVKPKKHIIANPNCTTIGMLMALTSLHEAFVIQEIVCSSYQSVSGAGHKGIDVLGSEVQGFFQSKDIRPSKFVHNIAFNLLPVIGTLNQEGHSEEEIKVAQETQKILDESIKVSASCIRVPTFIGHGLSLHIRCEDTIDLREARAVLSESPGIRLMDAPAQGVYPILTDVQGQDDVLVGRLRHGSSNRSLQLWVVSDNLRKGAALNSIQILEEILKQKWM